MAMEKFKAPPLPIATPDYDVLQQRQLLRVLQIYFDQLDSQTPLQAEYFKGRGDELTIPCALYYSTQDQTAAAINTAYDITYNNVYFENELTLTNNKEIYVTRSGIYNFQLSAQIYSGNSSAKTMQVWINRDGTDIGYSAHANTSTLNGGYSQKNAGFNIDLEAGSYLKLRWATTDTSLRLDSTAPSPPYPGISSVILAVNFVSSTRGFTIATPP